MPHKRDFVSEISKELGGAITPNLSLSSDSSDLYEAYIWSLVLRSARNEGATITYRDVNGETVVGTFVFRTSPGEISSTGQAYCHAEVSFHNCPPLEAHVGIYVAGKSTVRHEADVAVLYKNEADFCRTNYAAPRNSKVILSVECKHYLKSDVGISLGRSYLGLTDEILKNDRFFVATRGTDSVKALLTHHRREWETGVLPMNQNLENRILGSFEKVFRNYKVKA